MAFFGVPLSGLIASQDQLTSVSNNLANLDTVGFKDQTVSFSDLFAQSSLVNQSNDPISTGLGVTASQTNSDFTDGGISATGIASNAALSGNGFFVVQGTNGAPTYTRAGDFTANAQGFLTSPSGEEVLGYGATNGVVSTTGAIQPLKVALGSVIPATATSEFQITANLNSAAAVGSKFSSTTPVYDSLGAQHVLTVTYTKTASNSWSYTATLPAADLSSGAATAATAASPSTSTYTFGAATDTLSGSATIALGSGSPVTVSAAGLTVTQFAAALNGNATLQSEGITATLSGNQITLSGPASGAGGNLVLGGTVTDTTTSATITPSTPTTATEASTGAIVSQGTLSFDSSGNLELQPVTPATTPATYVQSISINVPQFADGGAASTLTWSLTDKNGNGTITQTDLASTTAATQNGQGSGTLTSYSIQSDGTIEGNYSNGQTNALGQIALATFANTQGLARVGGNDYQATPGSGAASIGVAGTGGRGTITGGSVEASNVDVAAEFSKMIEAQQAYSANAKTITTFQQVSQATIAMIQG
jgi:flagellar hook protein FlgE